jgi:hypothetical protein
MLNKVAIAVEIERKRKADRKFEVFGASEHRYKMNNPIKGATVRLLEKQFGITLPSTYRSFITQVANGGAGPGYGMLPFNIACSSYKTAHAAAGYGMIPTTENLLPLCSHGCGDASFLVIGGKHSGNIWEFDSLLACYLPVINEPENLRDFFELPIDQYEVQIPQLIARYAKKLDKERVSFEQWFNRWLQT